MKRANSRLTSESFKARRNRTALVILSAAVSSVAWSSSYGAGNTVTWSGADTATNTTWSDTANWTGGVVPGSTTGISSQDWAVFNNTPTSNVVTVDANRNIMDIVFDTANATNFAIGGGGNAGNPFPLLLTNGGEINETSTVNAATSETINSDLVLEGSSYTFNNDALGSNLTGLAIAGNISGGVAGPTTLTLSGANELTATSSNSEITGSISDGASSGLSLVKNGTGDWELRTTGSNTYSGSTIINSGDLRLTTVGSLPTNTDVTINGASLGELLLSVTGAPFPTAHSVTVNSGGIFAESSNNCGMDIDNNSGFALTLNAQTVTLDPKYAVNVFLEGTGPSTTGGIVLLDNTAFAMSISMTKNLDLGTVNRMIYTTHDACSTDLQINGVISGTGGIIKAGPGTVKLQQTGTETFTGSIEIQEGSIKLIGSNTAILNGSNAVLIDGGNLNLNGGDATFGPVVATSGNTSSAAARILAPSFTFNIASGTTFAVGSSLGDASAPAASTINGPGQVTMSGTNNTYTGGTTVNTGTLLANMNANGSPLSTGAVSLNGAVLSLDPSATAGSGTPITYTLANGSPSTQLTYGGGDLMNIKLGNETSVTATFGGASPSGSVLNRINNGTLVIAPANGTAATNLGVNEELLLTAAPTLTNGIVNTSIVGANNDTTASGDFLTYGANGFVLATYSASTDINTAGANAVYLATATSNNVLSGSGAVYALNAGAQVITVGGTLTVGNNSGQAGVILNGGTIAGGTLAFGAAEGTVYSSKADSFITSNITGTGGLTTFGQGKLNINGNNTGLSGGLNINEGTLVVSADANLGSASNPIKFGGGTLQFGAAFNPASTHAITLNAGSGTIDPQTGTVTIASAIGGSGNLTLGIAATTGSLVLAGANTYAGNTTINTGTLQVGNGGANESLGGGAIVNNSALVFAGGSAAGTATFGNTISGSGSLTQAGSNVVSLSGSNTYTGATSVTSGTLQTANANALGFGGAVVSPNPIAGATVSGTGVLDLDGQALNKSVTLNGGTLSNSNVSSAASIGTGVNGYVVTSGGSGLSEDLAAVTGGGGSTASLKLLLGVTNSTFAITSGGAGYTANPTVTISGGGGTGATATATETGGVVTSITITNPGSGYWGSPSISLTGTDTTAATITANPNNFTAVGTQAILAGSGYTSAPTVTATPQSNPGNTVVEPTLSAVLNTINVQSSSTINGAGAFNISTPITGTVPSGTATLTLDGTNASNAISGAITNGVAGGNIALKKSNTSIWTLSGVNTYTGGTTVTGGTLVAATTGSLPNLTNVSNSGTLKIFGNQTLGSLAGTGSLVVGNGSAPNTVKLNNNSGGATEGGLTIGTGSTLDIANNHLILSYAPGTQATTDSTIRSYLIGGYAGGAWTGAGINSSSAAANSGFAVGYADGADGVVAGLSSGQLEIKYTLYGDANLDGLVSGVDFTILVGNLGKSVNAWDKGDFNYDGVVSGIDFTALVGNLGKAANGADVTIPASDLAAIDAFAASNGLLSSVPEPATMSILALGTIGMLSRRRRRNA